MSAAPRLPRRLEKTSLNLTGSAASDPKLPPCRSTWRSRVVSAMAETSSGSLQANTITATSPSDERGLAPHAPQAHRFEPRRDPVQRESQLNAPTVLGFGHGTTHRVLEQTPDWFRFQGDLTRRSTQ